METEVEERLALKQRMQPGTAKKNPVSVAVEE